MYFSSVIVFRNYNCTFFIYIITLKNTKYKYIIDKLRRAYVMIILITLKKHTDNI